MKKLKKKKKKIGKLKKKIFLETFKIVQNLQI